MLINEQVASNISENYGSATFLTVCCSTYDQVTVLPDMHWQYCSHSIAWEFLHTHGNMADNEVLLNASLLGILNNRKINTKTWIRP